MKRHVGFTLIELLIAIAIVGILAVVALPMFGEQLAKSRRSEAIATLAELQLREERWRASHSTYGTMDDLTGGATATTSFNDSKQHYTFSASGNTGTDVLLTATPKGAQVGDRCGNFQLQIDNGVVVKTTSTSAARCW